ncbi:MAG: hypothetical protein AABN95_22670, partial [Acidobacteriota bacterium]
RQPAERQSLSAVCGGRAAGRGLQDLVKLTFRAKQWQPLPDFGRVHNRSRSYLNLSLLVTPL